MAYIKIGDDYTIELSSSQLWLTRDEAIVRALFHHERKHRNWRLPTKVELRYIYDASYFPDDLDEDYLCLDDVVYLALSLKVPSMKFLVRFVRTI